MAFRRVLFGVLTPSLGGHTRTAVALADVLRSRGHTIDFVVAAKSATERAESWQQRSALIHAAGFTVLPVEGLYATLGQRAFRRNLRELVRRGSYDALHWFEEHGVRDAALVAAGERRAFVWTHTSGGVPAGYYGLGSAVVFTREVAEDARRRSPQTVTHILPARFDFRPLDSAFAARARREVRGRLGIADDDLLIVRVARCTSVYLRSVHAGIALTDRLNRAGRRAVFVHAGYVEDPQVALEIRRTVDNVNAAARRPIAHLVTDNTEPGIRYAAAADICIGSGRFAIESLALERPTLVAWGSRYPGMVDDENIEAIADTNFQGRNSELIASDDDVVSEMLEAVCRRLEEPASGARTNERCARFIRQRYSVEGAAETYERLYSDCAVSVAGFLQYYGNLRLLGREVFYRLPHGLRASRPANFLRRTHLWPGLPRND